MIKAIVKGGPHTAVDAAHSRGIQAIVSSHFGDKDTVLDIPKTNTLGGSQEVKLAQWMGEIVNAPFDDGTLLWYNIDGRVNCG